MNGCYNYISPSFIFILGFMIGIYVEKFNNNDNDNDNNDKKKILNFLV